MQGKIRLEKWGLFKAAALATYFGPPDCGASPCHALVCISRASQPASQPPRAQYTRAGLTRRLLSFVSEVGSIGVRHQIHRFLRALSLSRSRASLAHHSLHGKQSALGTWLTT